MTRFKNVSPLGALDVPALGRVVEAGEEFEVRDEVAELISGQVENFELLSEAKPPTLKELRDAAGQQGIDVPKGAKREEIIAAIAAHDKSEGSEQE